MKTTTETEIQKKLIKKFKSLLNDGHIDRNAELDILSGYGVESCKDLDAKDLLELCSKLEIEIHPEAGEEDKARKRLIRSIFSWRQAMGCSNVTMDEVKAIACRAAKADRFNRIPMEQLRSLYAAFNKKSRDLRNVTDLTAEMIDKLTSLN